MAPIQALFLFISILSLHYWHIFFRGVVQYAGCLLCMVVMGRKLPAAALGKICSDCFLYLDTGFPGLDQGSGVRRESKPGRYSDRRTYHRATPTETLAELCRSQSEQHRTHQTELRRAQKCLLVLQLQLEWAALTC
jgi:hypothetical protein